MAITPANGNGSGPSNPTRRSPEEVEFTAAAYLCRAVLTRLSLIAEGATGAPPADTAVVLSSGPWICQRCDSRNPGRTRSCSTCHGNRPVADRGVKQPHFSASKVPTGVRQGGDLTGPNGHAPSKNFSLWGHYSYRMERALAQKDTGLLLKLAGCATRDYELHYRLRPSYHGNHEAAVTELLRDCRGVSALEAAWQLGAPVKWVKRQRVVNGYDPELGEPRKQDPRRQRVLELHAEGWKQQAIADEIGISQQHVSRIVNGS